MPNSAPTPAVSSIASAPQNVTRDAPATTIACLLVFGAVAAKVGGASIVRGALRVTFWGALAMLLTAVVGALFGTTVN